MIAAIAISNTLPIVTGNVTHFEYLREVGWHLEINVDVARSAMRAVATGQPVGLWKPHPDDDADIAEAMKAANQRDLLSPEASEVFVRWLEGTGDDSWRVELE